MKFWDTSALVALLVEEEATAAVRTLLAADPQVVVWWGGRVECASALARPSRESPETSFTSARALLQLLWRGVLEVEPSEPVRSTAERLLDVHRLRAAAAVQLAAATR